MRLKATAALLLALAAGSCSTAILMRDEVRAQEQPKVPRWEYRVILTPVVNALLGEDDETIARFNKAYNELGAEGWEYVGPVYEERQGQLTVGRVIVLFRRPRS